MNDQLKSLYRYIFPAVGGLFVTYLYNVVDGIFVGQGIGPAALGAVNIAVPFITFVVAAAAMFPMGGGTVVAIRIGRSDKQGANNAFMTSFILSLFFSLFLMLIGMVFAQQIVNLSGASKLSDEMQQMATNYLFYYSAFSIPMLLSNCLAVFVRNDGSPTLPFVGMCVGAVCNIFLDWLFIFPLNMGVVGAAIASGLGQIAALCVLLSHFIRRKCELRFQATALDYQLVGKICKRGVPEAVSQLTTPVTALCYNLMLASLIGDIDISTFSVLSFIFSLANALLSGVAQELQPLWGNCYGKRDTEEMNYFLRYGLIINLVLAVLIYILLFYFAEFVIRIFNQDADLVTTAAKALPLFSLSFIPMALNLVFTALMFSSKRTIQANAIAISRGIIVKALAIFCMPILFSNQSIWLAPFAAEIFTLVLAVVLFKTTKLIYK